MELNPQQSKAAHHIEGPLLVIAGAGSGKTRIITARIQHLLNHGVPASSLLAVTFTNKAAQEMRERIYSLTNTFVLTTTFHSLGAKILRESISVLGFSPNFTIFDEEESEKLLKECLREMGVKETKELLKTTRLEISNAKNQLAEPKDAQSIYWLYQKKLKECNAVDFDDLLFLTAQIFKQFPEILKGYQNLWNFILIDEYQDTNHAQYIIIRLLAQNHHNVFAVGDPDQSIYSWRGATIDNILNFEIDFPGATTIPLEQNYRSTNTILQAANALIGHNMGRTPKNLWSDLGVGDKIGLLICDYDRDEAEFVISRLKHHQRLNHIPLDQCVIFYRTNFQSRLFEDALLRNRIPYTIIGGQSFYQRKEIKDILSFLRVVTSPRDFLAFMRTINIPKRGIGDAAVVKIREAAQSVDGNILLAIHHILEKKLPCKLSLKQLEGLQEYLVAIVGLQEAIKANIPLHEIVSLAIERTRYLEYLKEDPETFQERRDNIQELIAKTYEFEDKVGADALISFLEELSLKSTREDLAPDEKCLKLMTLHNGKGLEFELAFLVGMEEDLFPHANSKDEPSLIEEERRLCYVGMTRAKQFLYFSACRLRFLWGTQRRMHPSRFLKEVPSQYIRNFGATTEEENEDFSDGDSVIHRDFGEGVIKKKYNTSLGLTYDVYFSKSQTERTLIAKFAKLTAK